MLRIESRNGRVFAVDLAEVVAATFAEGVLTLHLPSGSTLAMGGESWGGHLSLEEANEIIDLWEYARMDFDDDSVAEEAVEPPPIKVAPPPPAPQPLKRKEAELDMTPVQPVSPAKRTGVTWKEAKKRARR